MNVRLTGLVLSSFLALASVMSGPVTAQEVTASTPAEFVATYDSLASAILATKQTEKNLVWSILSTTYAHAGAARARAAQAMKSDNQAQSQAALEELAGHVAQLGNEGDNAVAGIRKRLVEGGHHHNSVGESQGIYDTGFVVVTRSAKQKLLESSRKIAQLARDPNEGALAEEWANVEKVWQELSKEKKK